ncbi:unnamed protein product [Acidithrix sp. C25]|nr:unnamed protein product [Acidithrix sp. C25]
MALEQYDRAIWQSNSVTIGNYLKDDFSYLQKSSFVDQGRTNIDLSRR